MRDAPEVPVELALVVEADGLRSLGDHHAAPEQLPGAGDPEVGQVLVGGHPDLAAKSAHQVELVERRVLGEVVEGDLIGERVVQERAGMAHRSRRPRARRTVRAHDLAQRLGDQGGALDLGGVVADQRVVHRERELRGALARGEAGRLEVQGAAQAHRVGRGGDELGREPGALEREGRVDPQVAVDLAGLLELERARDMAAHLAAVPSVEGARIYHHHREILGVGDLGAILLLHPEHGRHRGGLGPPEPHPPAIVGRQHEPSLGQPRGLAWAFLAGVAFLVA